MNRFLTEAEPWKMKGEHESRRGPVVRTALEAVYAFSHFLAPVLPIATQQIFEHLHTAPVSAHNLREDFYNLTPGTPVTIGAILFQKIEDDEATAAGGGVAIPGKSAGQQKKGSAAMANKVEEVQHSIDFTKMDIRVGTIVKVWNHETSDRLYCEMIDVGDDTGPRQVASGLRSLYSLEDLQNRRVVVVCNLKESKFQGFMSRGMVLAAKSGDSLELLAPPTDSKIGERIFLQGYEEFASLTNDIVWEANKVKKMKVWESVAPGLSTNEDGLPTWNGNALLTSAGPLLSSTLKNVQIQ
jgi:methionine--tRNA ligase beta chain